MMATRFPLYQPAPFRGVPFFDRRLCSGNSPIDSAKLWPSALASSASSGQAITLSPPAGDAPAMHPSEPMQSSSNGRSSEEMDIAIPCGSMDEVEGVWSQDIEQAFQEAMAIYPPCGRRKIILSDEGKMYGRNELIARYIKIRCGKTRTRKQVSSHIQVLHRKKMRETHGPITKDLKQSSTSPSSMINGSLLSAAPAAIAPTPLPSTTPLITIKKEEAPPAVAAAAAALHPFLGKASPFLTSGLYPGGIWPQQFPPGMDIKNYEDFTPLLKDMMFNSMASLPPHVDTTAVQEGNRIASSKLTLSGFSAYMERARERIDIVQIPAVSDSPFENLAIDHFKDKYPRRMYELFEEGPKDAFYLVKCWANMNFDPSSPSALFAVDSLYESTEAFEISVSTKVITFGSEAVEKRERYAPTRRSDGKYSFLVEGSPLCDYMVRFINELKKSETTEVMERILENFTALMIVTNQETQETLLVVAFVFAVSDTSDSACSIFRLESA